LKILIIGSGGREHALAWRLARCASVEMVYAAPGNPGIARVGKCVTAGAGKTEELLGLAESLEADLTVVGPEAPLVAGVVDAFRKAGRAIIGPTAAAARLEGSKIFAKQFLSRAGIPTAGFVPVDNEADALAALDRFGFPVVLKADGLAAGKGVIVAQDRAEAESAIRGLLSGQLVGAAGSRLVIEEFLKGEEVSFIVLSDGRNILPLEPTQDHKAAGDGDTGPNTGGMGAYCDSRILSAEERQTVLDRIIVPAIAGMRAEGHPFTGFLYAGLMMTGAGPKVLEFNVRLGDPECQPLMHRMDADFAEVLMAAAHGDLAGARLDWREDPSVCIVLAAEGYPGKVRSGDRIEGIGDAEALGAAVFQAGTRLVSEGLVTSGGRVLGVTHSGPDLASAIERAYAAASRIRFDGMYYRKDIGQKGLKRWKAARG
jgi:phosphoribosylamine--glycine ligase